MATLDVFKSSAFSTRELSAAIDVIPNMWGRIGDLGVFSDESVRTPAFQIENRNGVLVLIQSSERGGPLPGADAGKRDMRDFRTRRFGQSRMITAEDVDGIRAFGTESELKQVQEEVNKRLLDMRASIDITREYLRAGALRGEVLDADGTSIVNLFTEFGVTEKEVDFDLGTAATDHAAKAREVRRHIQTNLKGDMMTGIRALCSPGFFDKLLATDDFKDAHKFYQSAVEPLREDTAGGTPWMGIVWEEYLGEGDVPQEDGTTVTNAFIPDGDARFFPVGTRQSFQMVNAPADYMETVNTPGQPTYAKVAPDPKFNRYVDVEAQTNCLPVCMRPAVLVRGHSTT